MTFRDWRFMLILFMVLILSNQGRAQHVIINEVMASNAGTIADEDGDYEDWIELFNYGEEDINLEGFGLSDDYGDLFRWYFPEVVIGPGEYLLVWASGKNRRLPGKPLHTIFSISSAGEEVLLTAPDGTIVDELEPVYIPTGITIGRIPGDASSWYYFDEPTPGTANTTNPWEGIQGPPDFSHPGGFYTSDFFLELSAGDETMIYYTLDGSVPDSANVGGTTFQYKNQYPEHPGSPVGPFLERSFRTHKYSDPIHISDHTGNPDGIHLINTSFTEMPLVPQDEVAEGVVVRARAYREGYLPGKVATHTYLPGEGIFDRFDLPVVSVAIPDTSLFEYSRGIYVAGKAFDNWRKDHPDADIWPAAPANWGYSGFGWEREMHLELFDAGGSALLRQNLGMRIHGGWSRSNPKKSLRVYARNIYDTDNEIHHVFFPGQGRTLDGRDLDVFKRLLFRTGGNGNRIIRDVVAQDLMQNTHVGIQRAEPAVHFVNGVYWGLMNFRDRQDRYHIAYEYDIDPDNVIIIDSPYKITGTGQLEEGVPGDLEYFNMFYRLVTQNDMSDDMMFNMAAGQLDMDSYIDYYLSFIYLANSDWGGRDHVGAKHFRFWRVRERSQKPFQDGKWRIMIWDFDNGFSDYNYDLLTDVFDPENEPSAIILNLFENEWFRHRFINRLADLMNTHFLPAHALDVLEKRLKAVSHEAPIDQGRWNNNSISNADHISNFLNRRPSRQKKELMDVFGLPDTSRVTLRTNPLRGSIRINTIQIKDGLPGVDDPGEWTGTYFHGLPLEIEAVPEPGMVFSHWEGLPEGTPARTTITLEHDTTLTAHFWDGIIHYWHFNDLPDDDFVESVNADYSLHPDEALITYPGSGPGYMDRVSEGSGLNAHMGVLPGYGLRVRNPSNTRSLLFRVPSTGHDHLGFSYAVRRTNNGARIQSVCFSPDNEASWQPLAPQVHVTTDYVRHAFDLSVYPETNDNPDLLIRILFTDDAAANTSGNNRFDNVVLKVAPLKLSEQNPPAGRIREHYSYSLMARYGESPYRFEKVGGRLPQGLELSEDGTISGTPIYKGSYVFEVEVTDARQAHARQTYVLKIFDDQLIHYWHFNNLPGTTLDTVFSDYSATEQRAFVYYHGTGDGYMDKVEGTGLNAWSDASAGSGLRVRNPSGQRELWFKVPSDGFDYLQFSFAVHRTNNGARWQLLQYSPDNGKNWASVGAQYRITTDYNLKTFNLYNYAYSADNPDLLLRILFLGPESDNTSGNNRFDNVVLRGVVAPEYIEKNELFVFPNPVTDGVLYFMEAYNVRLYDVYGRLVLSEQGARKISIPDLAGGVYFLITDEGKYAKILVP